MHLLRQFHQTQFGLLVLLGGIGVFASVLMLIFKDVILGFVAGIQIVSNRMLAPGDWLESYGWWCIFGCNIALRHIEDERDLQHHMAIFTNKADEIADRMNNWSLRERVFTMQYASHQRFLDWTGRMLALTLDNDDVKALVGTMGRFPTFRDTGWKLLQTARVVRDD